MKFIFSMITRLHLGKVHWVTAFFLLINFLGFSQQPSYVDVDDTYTTDQLIKDILVGSKCDLVSNVRY
ncbi:hypothetical protein SAMN05421741_1181, partial [Paenimyroides ummariense]